MLSPESRRPTEVANPAEPELEGESTGERTEIRTTSPTVLKGSGSSARRQIGRCSPEPPRCPLPLPGEMIDTFRLEEAIGVGGMGAVFRPLDTQLDRQVALKLLPPDQAADPEVVQPILPGRPLRRPARPREHRPGLQHRPRRRLPLHRL